MNNKIILAIVVNILFISNLQAEVLEQKLFELEWYYAPQQVKATPSRIFFHDVKMNTTSTIISIENKSGKVLMGVAYRLLVKNPDMRPLSASCNNSDPQDIFLDKISGDSYFYLPIEGLKVNNAMTCQLNFKKSVIPPYYMVIVDEGEIIES